MQQKSCYTIHSDIDNIMGYNELWQQHIQVYTKFDYSVLSILLVRDKAHNTERIHSEMSEAILSTLFWKSVKRQSSAIKDLKLC